MRREPAIPLFLWVTSALVVHALFGGGATEVVKVIEERLDIRSFAHLVSQQARLGSEPLEVSLSEEPAPSEALGPGHEDADTQETEEAVPEPDDSTEPKPEKKLESDEPEPKKKEPKKDPAAPPTPEQPKPAVETKPGPEQQPQQVVDSRRTSIVQEVEDENQEDNPDARFAAEHANRVKEETRAEVSSNDGDAGKPSLNGAQPTATPDPGNSDAEKFAQSEEVVGQKDRSIGEGGRDVEATPGAEAPVQPAAQAAAPPPPPAGAPAVAAQQAAPASQAQQGNPDTLASPTGTFTMPSAQTARRAQQGRAALPGRPGTNDALFGLGSQAVTKNGVNLNLSVSSAQAMMGADGLALMRKRAGEKRLAQHRGSFQNVGIDKWRPALENYVASVKPGNQTALNAARVPFAQYLNQIHQRLHQTFADSFLASLEGLPADHPLSNQDMSTHLEIALSREDGRIIRMGITKSSGVTMFDVGALESVKKAAPYGIPPGSIVSSDGNVYLHWEFHRRPIYACSTYFARPFILNLPPTQAPPRVEPPPRRDYDEKSPDERSGSNGKRNEQRPRPG